MAKYSDWRTDLREVMDDDTDSKKVTGKGVNNNKLIKINPKLGEAVEEIGGQILEMKEVDDVNKDETIEKDDDAEKKARMAEKVKKKEAMLKKRIVRMKMMAVNQGAADSIVAGYEPEGELVEGLKQARKNVGADKCWDGYKAKGTKKKGGKEVPNCVKEGKKKGLWDNIHAKRKRGEKPAKPGDKDYPKTLNVEKVELDEAERKLGDRLHRKRKLYDRTVKKAMDFARREGEAAGHARYRMGQLDTEMDKVKDKMKKEEVEVNEGVMKFIKDRVGGKKKSEKKAEMDKTTEKLHDLRREKFKTDKQKEHEKYVNFLPVDEEVVTELNRYGKETGKATGSLNKRPGSPVATRNEPGSAVNIVRRMIRKDTGRPEGQQKKVKGAKGLAQPGDRRFTPAQTISRMRAQVAAADAAMRDTRGT